MEMSGNFPFCVPVAAGIVGVFMNNRIEAAAGLPVGCGGSARFWVWGSQPPSAIPKKPIFSETSLPFTSCVLVAFRHHVRFFLNPFSPICLQPEAGGAFQPDGAGYRKYFGIKEAGDSHKRTGEKPTRSPEKSSKSFRNESLKKDKILSRVTPQTLPQPLHDPKLPSAGSSPSGTSPPGRCTRPGARSGPRQVSPSVHRRP